MELRVASANWQFGGLDRQTGDRSQWCRTMDALIAWDPHLLFAQEIMGRQPYDLHRHAWATGNALGMIPLVGPASLQSASGNHPAIFVKVSAGLEIVDHGPPSTLPGLAWCEAEVSVPELPVPLHLFSVHFPCRSATAQLQQAETLACYAATLETPVIAAGDWNSYAPDAFLTGDVLARLPPHLRPPRMHARSDGTFAVNTTVYDTLISTGLLDAATLLAAERRDPRDLTPTGAGGGRVDRMHVSSSLAPLLSEYLQRDTGGSDHNALMVKFRTEKFLVRADTHPGP